MRKAGFEVAAENGDEWSGGRKKKRPNAPSVDVYYSMRIVPNANSVVNTLNTPCKNGANL